MSRVLQIVMIPCNSAPLERFWDDRLAILAEQFSSFNQTVLILLFEFQSFHSLVGLLDLSDFSDREGVNIALFAAVCKYKAPRVIACGGAVGVRVLIILTPAFCESHPSLLHLNL
jgi:hypothetical protein